MVARVAPCRCSRRLNRLLLIVPAGCVAVLGEQGDGDDFVIVKMVREGAFVMLDGFDQVVPQAEGGYDFFVHGFLPSYGLVGYPYESGEAHGIP